MSYLSWKTAPATVSEYDALRKQVEDDMKPFKELMDDIYRGMDSVDSKTGKNDRFKILGRILGSWASLPSIMYSWYTMTDRNAININNIHTMLHLSPTQCDTIANECLRFKNQILKKQWEGGQTFQYYISSFTALIDKKSGKQPKNDGGKRPSKKRQGGNPPSELITYEDVYKELDKVVESTIKMNIAAYQQFRMTTDSQNSIQKPKLSYIQRAATFYNWMSNDLGKVMTKLGVVRHPNNNRYNPEYQKVRQVIFPDKDLSSALLYLNGEGNNYNDTIKEVAMIAKNVLWALNDDVHALRQKLLGLLDEIIQAFTKKAVAATTSSWFRGGKRKGVIQKGGDHTPQDNLEMLYDMFRYQLRTPTINTPFEADIPEIQVENAKKNPQQIKYLGYFIITYIEANTLINNTKRGAHILTIVEYFYNAAVNQCKEIQEVKTLDNIILNKIQQLSWVNNIITRYHQLWNQITKDPILSDEDMKLLTSFNAFLKLESQNDKAATTSLAKTLLGYIAQNETALSKSSYWSSKLQEEKLYIAQSLAGDKFDDYIGADNTFQYNDFFTQQEMNMANDAYTLATLDSLVKATSMIPGQMQMQMPGQMQEQVQSLQINDTVTNAFQNENVLDINDISSTNCCEGGSDCDCCNCDCDCDCPS